MADEGKNLFDFQDIFNVNPFGDFSTHFNGKTQEITEIVMQQQQTANDFCNNILTEAQELEAAAIKANLIENEDEQFTNNLNNLNNNKLSDLDDDVVMMEEPQNLMVTSDTNNNSNSQFDADFGPETDVDDIEADDGIQFMAGEKEKAQFETKETEDLLDRGAMNLDNPFEAPLANPAGFASFENKIFEELSLHNPDLIKGNNPFTESSEDVPENMMVPTDYIDNKLIDTLAEEMSCEKVEVEEKMEFGEKKDFGFEIGGFEKEVDQVQQETAEFVVSGAGIEFHEEEEEEEKVEEPKAQG